MRYGTYLHLCNIALILTGFWAILITGSYFVPVLSGLAVTLGYALLGQRLTRAVPAPRWLWNVIALGLLGFLSYDSFFGELDLVGNGVKFVIYLQIVKLLSPKTNRDWLQIYLLSFLHVIASTVISDSITFAAPFLVYIVLAAWTLVFFNLKLQQDEATEPSRRDHAARTLLRSKSIITPRFLLASSFLSISIISFTLVIFYSFPRLTWGQFFKRAGKPQHVSGFSEQVELGTIGNIKTNNSIVFRVEFPEKEGLQIDTDQLYWRGTAADFFDGRAWHKTFPSRHRLHPDEESGVLTFRQTHTPGKMLLRHQVFLEPLSTQILFAADQLYRATWPKSLIDRIRRNSFVLYGDGYGGIHFSTWANLVSDLTYEAESLLGKPTPEILRAAPEKYGYWVERLFLQLPVLNPEVDQFIQDIPVPDGPAYDRALSIQRYLEENYSYTLNVQDVGTKDPLHFFFLEKRQGHCEYFSTALAIALRVHGIPSQQVMGFRGGEPNPYGGYLAVRQADAHTWVEVFFPNAGWVRFDPSPLDITAGKTKPRFQQFYQFFDYLRLRWNKYIVEYDLRTQATFIERLGRRVATMLRNRENRSEKGRHLEKDVDRKDLFRSFRFWEYFLLIGIVAFVFFRLGKFWLEKRRTSLQGNPYQKVLKKLARRGYTRRPGQTMWSLVDEFEKKEGKNLPLRTLTEMYYETRFGNCTFPPQAWQAKFTHFRVTLATKPKRKAA